MTRGRFASLQPCRTAELLRQKRLKALPAGSNPYALACASATSPSPSGAPETCPGFVAARPEFPRIPEYPPTARRARMTGESTHEIIVGRDGKVRDAHVVGTTFMVFALAADDAIRRSTYFPATLDGKPVASRFWVRVPFGIPKAVDASPARNRVTAFVPGDEPSVHRPKQYRFPAVRR